jgi:hypothetical protein
MLFIGYVIGYSDRLDSQSNTNFIAHLKTLIYNLTYLIKNSHLISTEFDKLLLGS